MLSSFRCLSLVLLVNLSPDFSKALNSEDVVVQSGNLGKISGLYMLTKNTRRPFLQFRGIPYAYPPTGPRRFMPSQLRSESLSPDGTAFNATAFGSPCPQVSGGQEDCLFLNIATPKVGNGSLAPVIVFIHGGAFVRGNANKFGGEFLLKENLVLVTFNYRVGVFGYFGLSTDSAPGNAGLYDALTVLKWVQTYIHHFGGNPNLVTIAGQSSGAASVTHLLLSPLSKGLFHRAIALSGSAISGWGTSKNPIQGSLRVAQLAMCCNTTCYDSSSVEPNVDAIVSCMQSAPIERIIHAQQTYQKEERKLGLLGFDAVSPAVTFKKLKAVPTILPDLPKNILKRKEQMNVPLMTGATKNDGEYSLGLLYAYFLAPNRLLKNGTFLSKDLVPTIISATGFDLGEESVESFQCTYLGKCSESGNFTKMLPGLLDISTVIFFKSGALETAQLHSALNQTYLYSFDFKGTHTEHNPKLPFPGGVAHSDDTIYLFPVQPGLDFSPCEQKVSNAMIRIWADFAKFGKPTGITALFWPHFDSKGRYLSINVKSKVRDEYIKDVIGASRFLFDESYSC